MDLFQIIIKWGVVINYRSRNGKSRGGTFTLLPFIFLRGGISDLVRVGVDCVKNIILSLGFETELFSHPSLTQKWKYPQSENSLPDGGMHLCTSSSKFSISAFISAFISVHILFSREDLFLQTYIRYRLKTAMVYGVIMFVFISHGCDATTQGFH